MPDFHQPDETDRRRAEATGAAEGSTGDWAEQVPLEELRERAAAQGIQDAGSLSHGELIDALRTERPSSRSDPNAPERPRT
jgi:hypothetical protein